MFTQNSNIHARFNRAYISEEDFREAEGLLLALATGQSDEVRSALILAAIISYARPFTANKSVSSAGATPTLPLKPSKDLTQEENALHETLLRLRNKALAHSDYELKPVKRTSGQLNSFSVQTPKFNLLTEPINLPEFLLLCRKLKMHSARLSMNLNNKLVDSVHVP